MADCTAEDLPVAGKVFNQGGSAKECLKYNIQGKEPYYKESFVGNKEYDQITHGVSTKTSLVASTLVNPPSKTYYQQRRINKMEQSYASKNSPLGKSNVQKFRKSVFSGVQPDNTQLYGRPTEFADEAGTIINPPKSRLKVQEEAKAGHVQYVRTHHDYDVGESYNRKYDWSGTNPRTTRFGIETPHYNDGRDMAETLRWLHKKRDEKTTTIVSKRVDEFRERTQPQLGKSHDPIADTLNVPPDHTYGIIIRPDKYGVGDLLHMRSPRNYLVGKDRERGVLATVRQHLKKANYHNFHDLRTAFRHYDYKNDGVLDADEIREACFKFNLPIDNSLLVSLMQYCAVENNDKIEDADLKLDYEKFVNYLNWKDKTEPAPMVAREKEERKSNRFQSKKKASEPVEIPRLCKQIDQAMTNHLTSSSAIDAVVGGVNTDAARAYGVPTVRSDIPAPRTRRISDLTNYGDESDAYGLVNPSIYTQAGVFERDFFELRSKDEIRDLYNKIGKNLSEEDFDKIWNKAVASCQKLTKRNQDKSSVEAFRTVYEEMIYS